MSQLWQVTTIMDDLLEDATQWLFQAGFSTTQVLDALGDETRAIQPGACVNGDSSNDGGAIASTNMNAGLGDYTVTGWIKPGAISSFHTIMNLNQHLYIFINASGVLSLSFAGLGSWNPGITLVSGTVYRWAFSVDRSGNITLRWNGVNYTRSAADFVATDLQTGGATWNVLSINGVGAEPWSGKAWDYRYFKGVALTNAQIDTVHKGPALDLETRWIRFDEQAGTSFYCAVTGLVGTWSNITVSTFHTIDSGVVYNHANVVGFSDGVGGVILPRDESDKTKDVLGGLLDYIGQVKHNANMVEAHCGTPDGGNDELVFPGGIPAGVVVRSTMGTSVPTVDAANDKITFTAGTVWELFLETSGGALWGIFPVQAGAGTDEWDVSDNGNHAVWTNITENTFWAGSQNFTHRNLLVGFRLAGEVKIPVLADGTAAADGNAITNPAGIGHNGAETLLFMPAIPPVLRDAAFWDTARNYAAIVADYAEAHRTLTDVSQPNKHNLFTFTVPLSGPSLDAMRRFLNQ